MTIFSWLDLSIPILVIFRPNYEKVLSKIKTDSSLGKPVFWRNILTIAASILLDTPVLSQPAARVPDTKGKCPEELDPNPSCSSCAWVLVFNEICNGKKIELDHLVKVSEYAANCGKREIFTHPQFGVGTMYLGLFFPGDPARGAFRRFVMNENLSKHLSPSQIWEK